MLEGLWVVSFLAPVDPKMNLNGGVAVIETGRLLGGDSGYYYIGDIYGESRDSWGINLRITRHDPNIESVFGDIDTFELTGGFTQQADDSLGRTTLVARLVEAQTGIEMIVQLSKVSVLP